MPRFNIYLMAAIFALVIASPAMSYADTPDLGTPMDSEALQKTTGTGTATITSTVSNNSMGAVGYTGLVSNVSATGNSGLTTMIVNTGNQVSISTATTVDITFQ